MADGNTYIIDYGKLNGSWGGGFQYAKKASSATDDYKNAVKKYLVDSLSGLPGSDSKGYISSATSLANDKANELVKLKTDFTNLSNNTDLFQKAAERTDKFVSDEYNRYADKSGIESQGFFAKIGECLYNLFFVDIPNAVATVIPIFSKVIDGARELLRVAEEIMEEFREWFNSEIVTAYRNIIGAVADVFLTTVSLIGGMVALVGTIVAFPAIGIASLAVVSFCGVILIAKGFVDMNATINDNLKAIEYYKSADKKNLERNDESYSDRALAHYYSGVKDAKTSAERNDFGDSKANYRYNFFANTLDAVGDFSSNTMQAVAFFNSLLSFSFVKGADGKTVVGHDFSKDNIKYNIEDLIEKEAGIYRELNFEKGRIETKFNLKTLILGKEKTKESYEIISDIYKTVIGIGEGKNGKIESYKDFADRIGKIPIIGRASDVTSIITKGVDMIEKREGFAKKYYEQYDPDAVKKAIRNGLSLDPVMY